MKKEPLRDEKFLNQKRGYLSHFFMIKKRPLRGVNFFRPKEGVYVSFLPFEPSNFCGQIPNFVPHGILKNLHLPGENRFLPKLLLAKKNYVHDLIQEHY